MTKSERACQISAVLAWAARHRQILTYGLLSKLVGAPAPALGAWLEPIQSYRLFEGLPPLTILVVQQSSGLPGGGFTAAGAAEFAAQQLAVFDFDWLAHGNPDPCAL